MSAAKREPVQDREPDDHNIVDAPDAAPAPKLEGVRWLGRLRPLLARLRGDACERDRAGNRRLFYDDVCALLLLTFFNPTVKTLRNISAASKLKQIKKRLGCQEASLASLSESLRVFDPELLEGVVRELFGELPDAPNVDPRLKELALVPTAVDGTVLRALRQVTQAAFATGEDRGFKFHAHFELLRGAPSFGCVTDAGGRGEHGEKAVLRDSIQAGRCYVVDRGYEEFALFNAIAKAGSGYVCRVRNDHALHEVRSREPTDEDRAAGVVSDAVGRMGSPNSKRVEHPDHPQRHVVVRVDIAPRASLKAGKKREVGRQDIVLATNLLDAPAEIVALLYRQRWLIELFFRWLKCVMQCRHLVSESASGVQIQMYCALIAFLLVQLAAGRDIKPDSWTYKLLCLYVEGLATEEDVLTYLQKRIAAAAKKPAG